MRHSGEGRASSLLRTAFAFLLLCLLFLKSGRAFPLLLHIIFSLSTLLLSSATSSTTTVAMLKPRTPGRWAEEVAEVAEVVGVIKLAHGKQNALVYRL